jgi:hypothetical protein
MSLAYLLTLIHFVILVFTLGSILVVAVDTKLHVCARNVFAGQYHAFLTISQGSTIFSTELLTTSTTTYISCPVEQASRQAINPPCYDILITEIQITELKRKLNNYLTRILQYRTTGVACFNSNSFINYLINHITTHKPYQHLLCWEQGAIIEEKLKTFPPGVSSTCRLDELNSMIATRTAQTGTNQKIETDISRLSSDVERIKTDKILQPSNADLEKNDEIEMVNDARNLINDDLSPNLRNET